MAGFQCPLCKRVVRLIERNGSPAIEPHDWRGEPGDLIDRLHQVQYEMTCPLSDHAVRKQSRKSF